MRTVFLFETMSITYHFLFYYQKRFKYSLSEVGTRSLNLVVASIVNWVHSPQLVIDNSTQNAHFIEFGVWEGFILVSRIVVAVECQFELLTIFTFGV